MTIEASDNSGYKLEIKEGIASLISPEQEMLCEFMLDEQEEGWITCSERLPDESGTYIVNAIENSIVHVTFAKWLPRMKKWNLFGKRSYWKITAWQPLPEPYKG